MSVMATVEPAEAAVTLSASEISLAVSCWKSRQRVES